MAKSKIEMTGSISTSRGITRISFLYFFSLLGTLSVFFRFASQKASNEDKYLNRDKTTQFSVSIYDLRCFFENFNLLSHC